MRVALVSPYSWTYPGGVMRHVEALRRELVLAGDDVDVLAPYDPDDRLTRRLHRGAAPERRELPDWVRSMGRSVGWPANGAVSNLALRPQAIPVLRRALAAGDYDVIHLHEPVAPMLCWDALMSARAPIVATFHSYSTSPIAANLGTLAGARLRLNRIRVRIAVSEAAAWTGRRYFGGRYRIIPNGVDLPSVQRPESSEQPGGRRPQGGPLKIVFVGQAVERKGLPVLLRAFEALREQVDVRLQIVGADRAEVEQLLIGDDRDIEILGRVDDRRKLKALMAADVLCAPSLGGESFGMVLTEAFAAGRPVVASAIAGYRDVVTDGVDGLLVAPADGTKLAEALRSLALDRELTAALANGAYESARRYAWPQVAARVSAAYEDAIALAQSERELPLAAPRRAALRYGLRPADLLAPVPAMRIASIEPRAQRQRRYGWALVRKVLTALLAAAVVAGSVVAVERIGVGQIGDALLTATPTWVILALGLMCASMIVRAVAWHQILRAATTSRRGPPTLRDAIAGTSIGVLMSATLPARLGEPARAVVVARRLGRARDGVGVVLGTIVSQTFLNVLALVVLGVVMFASVDVFDQHRAALALIVVTPLAALALIVGTPVLLVRRGHRASPRVRAVIARVTRMLRQIRTGLNIFGDLRRGSIAVFAQLLAWVVQWLACYLLLVAFGLDDLAGMAAAAAVLFAVNVTAVLPATPSNLGVFQAACVFVLHSGYGVSVQEALGYGIVLQAVEIATAVIMGGPALLREGVSWRDVRMRALHATPVRLKPLESGAEIEA